MRTCEKSGGGRGIQTTPSASLGEPRAEAAFGIISGAPEGPKKGPTKADAFERRQAEDALARMREQERKAPANPHRWHLPAGLTEPELAQGYARVPHPVEVVAMGALLAGAAACAMGVWPWPLPHSGGA